MSTFQNSKSNYNNNKSVFNATRIGGSVSSNKCSKNKYLSQSDIEITSLSSSSRPHSADSNISSLTSAHMKKGRLFLFFFKVSNFYS